MTDARSWMDRVDRAGLEHLVLDTDGTMVGPPATALFNPHRTHRYCLTRQWNPDRAPAVFIMLNPSTADAFRLDPTLTRCRSFATAADAGGMVILNAFALRATDPRELARHPHPVGPDNDQVIRAVLATAPGPVVLGWGSHTFLRRTGRDRHVVDLIRAAGLTATALGVTKDGYPRHPLYLPASARPAPYALEPA